MSIQMHSKGKMLRDFGISQKLQNAVPFLVFEALLWYHGVAHVCAVIIHSEGWKKTWGMELIWRS